MKKKLLSVALSGAMLVGGALSFASCDGGADYTVGILQLTQHVALDQANKGFQDKLTALLEAEGKTVEFLDENAAGEQSNNITIAETFVNKNVDLMYSIATSSSQACASASTEIPVVFSAVTNAVEAGLVASNDAPGANVTGASDLNPVEDQIELIGLLLSEKVTSSSEIKVGLLYTAAEPNSVYQVSLAKAACDKFGFEYVEKGIGDANDLAAAFSSLNADGVDAIFLPTDNVLANAAAQVHSTNIDGYNIPIVCGESGMNDACGVATYGISYYSLGEEAAVLAYQILVEGKSPANIPVTFAKDIELTVNTQVASEIGFTIPAAVTDLLK